LKSDDFPMTRSCTADWQRICAACSEFAYSCADFAQTQDHHRNAGNAAEQFSRPSPSDTRNTHPSFDSFRSPGLSACRAAARLGRPGNLIRSRGHHEIMISDKY
jgi:hypothetical protein